jgi:Protein of unknown function (DUF1571)
MRRTSLHALVALVCLQGLARADDTPVVAPPAVLGPSANGLIASASPPAGGLPALSTLSDGERAELVRSAQPAALAALCRRTSVPELLTLAHRTLESLGTYAARMTKQERVGGELLEPQTVELTMRERPRASLLRYVSGPAAGRKVLYDETQRKTQLRAHESGLKGIVGALWIDLDSRLTRGDSNHSVTEIGFGSILGFIEQDLARSKAFGGETRFDEGFDGHGDWCMRFTAPAGATGLIGDDTRICYDLTLALPVSLAVSLHGQLIERYTYEQVEPRTLAPDFFNVQAQEL